MFEKHCMTKRSHDKGAFTFCCSISIPVTMTLWLNAICYSYSSKELTNIPSYRCGNSVISRYLSVNTGELGSSPLCQPLYQLGYNVTILALFLRTGTFPCYRCGNFRTPADPAVRARKCELWPIVQMIKATSLVSDNSPLLTRKNSGCRNQSNLRLYRT